MTATRRTRASTSAEADPAAASSSARPPPAKRARRSPTEDVKPKIKPEPEDDADDIGVQRRRVRSTASATLPSEMTETPLAKLYDAMRELSAVKEEQDAKPEKNGVVVYWSRNKDLRLEDNTALSYASGVAQDLGLPLLVLHIFSLGDYKAHDRSPRRIDFQLRQFAHLQAELALLDIPLYTITQPAQRRDVPRIVCDKLVEWGAVGLYANIEYEVDELRRDTEILERTKKGRETGEGWRGKVEYFKDFCIVAPGEVLTKQGKPYSVYSPYQRAWIAHINSHLGDYMVSQNAPLAPNPASARSHAVLGPMFAHELPTSLPGFELEGGEPEAARMRKIWPVGKGITEGIMHRFMRTKMRQAKFFEPPLEGDGDEVDDPKTKSKIGEYCEGRNRVDLDGTSHISAYLAAGLISPRECIRLAFEIAGSKELPGGRDSGIGMWCQEIAWRDFYQAVRSPSPPTLPPPLLPPRQADPPRAHEKVLAAWPRVSMGKPFNLKYDGTVEWALDNDEEKLQAWKEGRTGFPIVDAAMRALKEQGCESSTPTREPWWRADGALRAQICTTAAA
ncbi:DNA photolyase phr1 [Rhodotorula kratochvilovae]